MARSAQIKLSDVATSRVNNLNFMRFIAALMVIVSHCYSVVLGGDAGSYLLKLTGDRLSPGGVSVGVFFLFGGFLIAHSCEHHPEAKKFFSARILRLFPELLFVVIMTAFVFGPLFSTLSPAEYFTNPQTYKYLLNGALIMVHQLPGVFTNNPSGDVVNSVLREVFSASAKRCTCGSSVFPGCFDLGIQGPYYYLACFGPCDDCSVVCYGFRWHR